MIGKGHDHRNVALGEPIAAHVECAQDPIVCEQRGHNDRVLAEESHDGIHQGRSEEHTSELQSRLHLVCRLLLENNGPTPYFLPAVAAALSTKTSKSFLIAT